MLDFEGSVFEFIGDDFKNVFEKIDTISVCFSKGLGCAMGVNYYKYKFNSIISIYVFDFLFCSL